MRKNQKEIITLLYQDMLDELIHTKENFEKGLLTDEEYAYLVKKIDGQYHEIFALIYRL